MPKQTFFNLPDERRNRILEAAVDEFSEKDYEASSVSNIVDNSSIARGSFYQYFEDKEDLYTYILDIVLKERIEALEKMHPFEGTGDFGQIMLKMLKRGLQYESERPKHNRIFYRAMFGNTTTRELVGKRLREAVQMPVRRMLEFGMVKGYVRNDLDIDMVSYVLNLVLSDAIHSLGEKEDIDDIFEKITDLLSYGMAGKACDRI